MTTLNDYKDSVILNDTPVLGYILWYHVGESLQIQHSDLVKLIIENDAKISLPNPPKPGDVFKRACTAAQVLKVPTYKEGEYYNYTLRDVGYDETSVYKKLVQERVDGNNHELGFVEIGLVIFNKNTLQVSYHLDNEDGQEAFMIMKASVDEYIHVNLMTVTPYALRMSIMNSIQGPLFGASVRPGGGVYFVSKEHKDAIANIETVISQIENASLHYLPLVDDKKQRAMVRDSFEDESVAATQKLMSEITELLSSGTISAKKFMALQARYSSLLDKMKEYQSILGDALATSSATLELCETQIMHALESVE